MFEMKHIICEGAGHLLGLNKLGKVNGRKTETQHIHGFNAFLAIPGSIQPAGIAFRIFLFAVNISRDTKPQLKIVLRSLVFLIMVSHHTQIIKAPLGVLPVTLDLILYGPGNLTVPFLQELKFFVHYRLFVGQAKYIRGLVHNGGQIY